MKTAFNNESPDVLVTFKHLKVDAFGQLLVKFTFVGTRESYTMSVDRFYSEFTPVK